MNSDDDKLRFDAVLYVLGDMPTGEREAFEQRLIDEQEVREAVAEAVLVCQVTHDALCEAGPAHVSVQPAVDVDHTWRRVAVWAAMALAASIVFALVTGIGRDRSLPDGNRGKVVSSDSEQNADRDKLLAVAWLNSASLDDSADDDIVENDPSDADDMVDEEELAMADPNANTGALEADWFFEAINSPPAESVGSTTNTPQEG